MNARNIVKNLPYPIKQGGKYIYGAIPLPIRYGKVFRGMYDFLQESQWWSREQLEEYQFMQLEKLLNHAYENVPYYRRVFKKRGLKPKDIQTFSDLRKLPYLTKKNVKENLPDLIATNYPISRLQYVTTGGSSGTPMGLYWEKGLSEAKEWAFVWRQWNWAGHKFSQRSLVLRSNVVGRYKNGKRQWWEYDPRNNSLTLSAFDMTEENLFLYVEKIRKYKPRIIMGYASNIFLLVNFLRRQNLRINKIKAILTTSENLYPYQRKIIEEYLETKIYDHYGNTERNALVMECERGSYHIIPEYGIIELIGENDKEIINNGLKGELVATGFNYVMPFIRYKTEDIAVNSEQTCSCGRKFPLLKRIEGRLQEFIVAKNGDLISLGPAVFGIHSSEWTKVNEIQIVQKKKGELLINIVKDPSFSDKEVKEHIFNLCGERFERQFEFDVAFVGEISRTSRGKYRYLDQRLEIKHE
jgi:phenylacetate-CoA ligase